MKQRLRPSGCSNNNLVCGASPTGTEAIAHGVHTRSRTAPSMETHAELRCINSMVSPMADSPLGQKTARSRQARDALKDVRENGPASAHSPG